MLILYSFIMEKTVTATLEINLILALSISFWWKHHFCFFLQSNWHLWLLWDKIVCVTSELSLICLPSVWADLMFLLIIDGVLSVLTSKLNLSASGIRALSWASTVLQSHTSCRVSLQLRPDHKWMSAWARGLAVSLSLVVLFHSSQCWETESLSVKSAVSYTADYVRTWSCFFQHETAFCLSYLKKEMKLIIFIFTAFFQMIYSQVVTWWSEASV